MLEGNPELRNIFNQAHQARGRQQKALAEAVLAYAENIENPAVLLPAVKFIASKHATVGIRAEHYPIVGRHLLASIREVLGEAASDELLEAWGAAYEQLADLTAAYNNVAVPYNEIATAVNENGWMNDEQTATEMKALSDTLGFIGKGLTEDISLLDGSDFDALIDYLENEFPPALEELSERVSVPYEAG